MLQKMENIKCLLVLFCFFCAAEQAKVKVSVYYETLCPDSKAFIRDQFYPTYQKLGKEYIDIDFVPYGHATESEQSGSWTFTCQHGPAECFGNLYHSCALALNSDKDATSNFIYCTMIGDPSSVVYLEECSKSAGLSWEVINNCYKNADQCSRYLHENGEKTRAVEDTSFIPTIVLNDKFDAKNQQRSLIDFENLICDTLNNEPEICNKQEIEVIMY